MVRLLGFRALEVACRTERPWRVLQIARLYPASALAGLAALNAAVYWLLFVYPTNLLALYSRPLVDLRRLSEGEPGARWRLSVGFALLAAIYWLGWRLAHRTQGTWAWTAVLGGGAISGAVLLFLYPFGAADLFDNIMHGRILGVYGANPFAQIPADFASDPFYRYVGWRRFPSAYGPLWELLAAATARLAGDGIVASALAFKALGGAFLAGSVAVVAWLLRRVAPERALSGTLLLAWNPLVLFETLGQGHNDVAMVFWVLACAGCLALGRRTLAVLALVVGALVKFVPVLLLPAAGLVALRGLAGTRARVQFVAVTACLALILVTVAYVPFWTGIETLGLENRGQLFTSSLPATARAVLEPSMGRQRASEAVGAIAAALTAAFALWRGASAGRRPSWRSFAQAAFATLIFYLLVTCLWFQQWYAIWPLALVPLLPAGYVAGAGVLFGFAVLAKPLLFEPLWLWPNPQPDRAWLELRLGPAVMAVPWLATVAAVWLEQRRGR
jgi:hypothetical protein